MAADLERLAIGLAIAIANFGNLISAAARSLYIFLELEGALT